MINIAQYFPITDPTLIFFVVLLIILFAPIIMGKLRIPHSRSGTGILWFCLEQLRCAGTLGLLRADCSIILRVYDGKQVFFRIC